MGRKQSKSGKSKKGRIRCYGEKRRRGLQSKEKNNSKRRNKTGNIVIIFLFYLFVFNLFSIFANFLKEKQI